MKWLIGAATSLMLMSSAAWAGASADALRSNLEAGTLAAGIEALNSSDDAEALAARGTLKFLAAIEHLGQAFHRHGLEVSRQQVMGFPILRMPVPPNPKPEKLDYAGFRALLATLVDELAAAEKDLAQVGDKPVALPLDLAKIGTLNFYEPDEERFPATRLAREAFKRVTPEGIESLIRMNEEMTAALKAHDMFAHRRSNFRLHFRFYEMADQPSTLHFVRILWAKYPFEMLSVMPNRLADVIDEHQKFLDALKSGDGKAVIRAVQAHIESGHRKFKKHYAAELGKVHK